MLPNIYYYIKSRIFYIFGENELLRKLVNFAHIYGLLIACVEIIL